MFNSECTATCLSGKFPGGIEKIDLACTNGTWHFGDTTTVPDCLRKYISQNIMKEPVAKEPVYWNDFTLWDTATRYSRCGQKSYSIILFVPVCKIISVHEIYSDSLFRVWSFLFDIPIPKPITSWLTQKKYYMYIVKL